MSQSSPAISLSNRRLAVVVSALGLAQIISWGSFYYSIAVLGETMRRDLGVDSSLLFGAFTFSLLVSGMAAPTVGHMIDRYGGRLVLCSGSLIASVAAFSWANAQGVVSLFLACFLCGLTMSICLYEAAFITLNQIAGERYRSAITALTLWGGLASTVFWPLSQWLLSSIGWRDTLFLYAGLQLLVCLPLHALVLPSARRTRHADGKREQPAVNTAGGSRYYWLATGFAIGSFVLSVLSVHIIGLLKDAGLTPAQAVLVATLIGPMQVLVRVLEFVFARHAGPLVVGTVSFFLMVCATAALYFVDGYGVLAFGVAILYGFSNGSFTIVRGIVPAALFGREGYGALLGRLARPAFIARAMAPFAFSVTLSMGLRRTEAILLLAACSVLAGLSYLRAIRAA
jgi:MFS family permease